MISKHRFGFFFAAALVMALTAFSFHAPPVYASYDTVAAATEPIVIAVPVLVAADRVAVVDDRCSGVDRIDAHRQIFVTSSQPGQPWRRAASLGFVVIDPHIRA